MKTLLVIPARGGSKGIPRKNLLPVGGRPLIAYAIGAALAARRVGRVIVSTEDEEIAGTAREHGAEIPFLRPRELSGDGVSLIPVAAHAAKAMAELGFAADAVMTLQPTAPLVRPETIDAAIALMQDTGCDSVSTVEEIAQHPYRAFSRDAEERLVPLFPDKVHLLQRQDRPPFYYPTGGVYLRRRHLLEQWSGRDFCMGSDARSIAVQRHEALNIDTMEDIYLLEARLRLGPPA